MRRIGVASGLAVAVVCVTIVSGTSAARSAASCGGRARARHAGSLSGVAVTSRCNAWAVGSYSNGAADLTLVEHWNGKTWNAQHSPNPGGSGELFGVAAVSARDAWAVGDSGGGSSTLIEHWNGKAWKVQNSLNPGASNSLRGVAAVSASDAWAVGYYYTASDVQQTLVEHWNGTAWKIQHSPSPSSCGGQLEAVAVTSPSNAWAVGDCGLGTLVEHWNGRAWKVQPSALRGGSYGNYLLGVAALSARNAWAVGGGVGTPSDAYRFPLIGHWNGKRWKTQPGPNPYGLQLLGVAAVSARDAWAVGHGGFSNGVIEHWNGKKWKRSTPGTGIPAGVAALSARDAWAVGDKGNGRIMIEHWNGKAWKG